MSGFEILPSRARYSPGEAIEFEVRSAPGPGTLTVWSLGEEVARIEYRGGETVALAALPAGGYGIELAVSEHTVRTAIDVSASALSRLRYGFTVDYSPGRDAAGLTDTVRRLHLTGVQFYDWAYRHAELLGGGEEYRDALDQPVSLDTVRRLAAAVRAAGAVALGYAAVYAVGPEEWASWKHRALLTPSGVPYGLGDFLFLVDPAADDWIASFTAQLARARSEVGFDGFHLDQYGYPKRAERPDGRAVDVAESFRTIIEAARRSNPDSVLVFNNVNDFPTWVTASTRQDAVYIEVWEPHLTLGSLGQVVARARSLAQGKPVVIAAYQHVYDTAPALAADHATALTMATLYSHGATQLLAGEADRILVDPYYVRNHTVEDSTAELLKRWYDFLVEHDALLMDPEIVDVTGSYAGVYNDDCEVRFDSAEVSMSADAGTVWRRVTEVGDALVVHLINLCGQSDTLWDAPRALATNPGHGVLRFRRAGAGLPRVRIADPDRSPRLIDVEVSAEGDWAVATLPEFAIWQLVVIDRPHADPKR
ncbi:glycoside hydrolase family 66 protein [Lysinimonas soli]|uniref:Glycoside hydrolase family 66 protein n=1 Tax=Lysinimonas soli TaxID=1074233 RepID=A0ABW0NS38_9MICO